MLLDPPPLCHKPSHSIAGNLFYVFCEYYVKGFLTLEVRGQSARSGFTVLKV